MSAGDNRRLRRFGLVAAGLLLVVSVLIAHRFLPQQASELAIETIQSLHGPGFGIVSLLVFFFLPGGDHPGNRYLKAAALAMVLAALAEASQIPGPRDAQFSDLATDAIGMVGFLGVRALFDRDVRRMWDKRQTILLFLISAAALVAAMTPLLWSSYALVQRHRSIPQILNFDAAWEKAFSSSLDGKVDIIAAPSEWPTNSRNIGRLQSAGRWGIMLYLYPHADWSAYSAVSFVAATGDSEPQQLSIGIRDIRPGEEAPEARFMTNIVVGPVPTRYRISFDDIARGVTARKFDIAHVHDLVISEAHAWNGVEILVDDFRLE